MTQLGIQVVSTTSTIPINNLSVVGITFAK